MKAPALLLSAVALACALLTASCKPGTSAARDDFRARAGAKADAWRQLVDKAREEAALPIEKCEAQLADPPPHTDTHLVRVMIGHLRKHSETLADKAAAFAETMRISEAEWEARNWEGYVIPNTPPDLPPSDTCSPYAWPNPPSATAIPLP